MHIIVATSRGKKLTKLHDPPRTWLTYIPGGTLDELTEAAVKLLAEARAHVRRWTYRQVDFVYFVGGLPDLTTRDKWRVFDGEKQYEEVYFNEDPHDTRDRMKVTLKRAASTVLALDAIPVFSTIVPSHIERWNHTRLGQHKTTHLLHFKDYKEMQIGLLQATIYTNQYIHELNLENGVVTPSLAKKILFSRRLRYRFRHAALEDGVHPNEEAADDWCTRISDAMEYNDNLVNPQLPTRRDVVYH